MLNSSQITILAIDDNADNLVIISALLGESFPEAVLHRATNGEDGLRIARAENPDVILLDIVMSGMDGYAVCTALKADTATCDIPVVFVTALRGDTEHRMRALDCGAEGFLQKPIDASELTAQVLAMVKIKAHAVCTRTEQQRLQAMVAEQTRALEAAHSGTLSLLADLRREMEVSKASTTALAHSRTEMQAIYDNAPVMMCVIDSNRTLRYANPAFTAFVGVSEADLKGGSPGGAFGCINALDDPRGCGFGKDCAACSLRQALEDTLTSGLPHRSVEFRTEVQEGAERRDLVLLGSTAIIAMSTERTVLLCLNDVTEWKMAEMNLQRMARLYAMLSQINHAIVRTRDEKQLFREICSVAIEYGRFRMAWCGLLDPVDGMIRPAAHAGHEDGYLANVLIDSRETPQGLGPSGTAFRSGETCTSTDIATDAFMVPWRDEALKRGYRSSAAMPFKRKGAVVGILTLYAPEPGFFTDDERTFLDEISENISFALDAIATENERQHAEAELLHRADELAARNAELSRFNLAAVGRELRMIALKREVNELCAVRGEAPRYRLPNESDTEVVSATMPRLDPEHLDA
jgi:CheY-like chemotaxis protein/GAF domain-containing protein